MQFKQIPLDQIDFGNRFRQEYKKIDELIEEIKEVGLIHPITVVDKAKNKDAYASIATDPSKPYLLIVGGRRTTAFLQGRFSATIPANVYDKPLNEYEVRRIELMENISREDLTWTEESMLTLEIHTLEQKIKGVKKTSSGTGHGLKETAEILGKSKSAVKLDLDLAQAIQHLPHLKDIKNKSDAIKAVRQMQKSVVASDRAAKVREDLNTKGSDKVKKELMDSFILGDFLKEVQKLDHRSFDLVEIDPPYAIDLGNIKKGSKHTTLNYDEIASKEYEEFMRQTLSQAYRVLKNDGWLVLWYAIDPWHSTMVKLLEEVGFKFTEIPALWIKDGGQTNRPQHFFGSSYEPFLYARKSEDARLNRPGLSNYLVHPKVNPDLKDHPTQRPISLMEDVITRFINKGKILVPFAGSGVTLRAAYNLGMKAVGFDTSEDPKNKYDIRISEHDFSKKFEL